MTEATVFEIGGRQAVMIPEEYRLPDGETVLISRVGHVLQLVPKGKAEAAFREGIDGFTDDFLKAGRQQGQPQERPDL